MRIGWTSPVSRTALLLALLSLGGPGALAQAARTWVDPPAEPGAAPQASPAPVPQPPSPGEPPARTAAPPPSVTLPEPVSPPAQTAQPRPAPEPAPEPPPARQAEQPAQAAPPGRPAPPAVAAQPREPRESRYGRDDAAKSFAITYLNSWSGPNEAVLDSTVEFYAPQVLFHGRTISMRALYNEKRRFVQRWPERDYRPRPESMGVTCNPAGEICTVHAVFDFTAANPERRTRSEGTGALQLIVQFVGEKPIIVAEHSTLLGQERNRD
jgi:hypothetical protein